MITTLYSKFVVDGDLLKTISNLLFLAVAILALIIFLQSIFYNKRPTITALTKIFYVNVLTAYLFLYNDNTNLFEINKVVILGGLMTITLIVSIIAILGHLMKRPKEDGTIIVIDENGKRKEVVGNAYKREFRRKKAKGFFVLFIRDLFMIVSILTVELIETIFMKAYYEISALVFNDAVLADISVYSIILVVGLVAVSFINWILRRCDTI